MHALRAALAVPVQLSALHTYSTLCMYVCMYVCRLYRNSHQAEVSPAISPAVFLTLETHHPSLCPSFLLCLLLLAVAFRAE